MALFAASTCSIVSGPKSSGSSTEVHPECLQAATIWISELLDGCNLLKCLFRQLASTTRQWCHLSLVFCLQSQLRLQSVTGICHIFIRCLQLFLLRLHENTTFPLIVSVDMLWSKSPPLPCLAMICSFCAWVVRMPPFSTVVSNNSWFNFCL